ncbi:MAG: methionine ABC transporter permease [Rothia sp. (in: high G+C Gram-positive bacteria)]|nr:methionine ABC transporter permease [Rothia sp. (in: high G+C Gram-positive bacteria)]
MNVLENAAVLSAAPKVQWDEFIPNKLVPALFDTIYMVALTMVIAGIIGLIIGILLYTTRQGNILANRPVNIVLNVLVNIVRPIPFIILLAALGPLTSAVIGSRLGVNAAIFAMCFGASFAIARIVEQNLVSIDPGVIEAARAMGASKGRILMTVMVPEALGPLILGYTFLVIGVVDMSAMAGYVGGGGLGKVALVDGYQRFNDAITWVVVLVIIVMVQLIQLVGNLLARKVMRR